MFNLRLDDTKLFNSVLSIISDFITEATFSITKEGLKLVAMDPSNISMVILDVLPSAFSQYNVSEPAEITINLDSLKSALKRAKATETISLTIEKNQLVVTILGKSTKKFYIPLLEKEEKENKIPSLEFKASIELDAKEFRDYIDDASIVGDAITIEASPERVIFTSGEAGSKVNIELTKTSDALIKIDVSEPVKAIYSVEYLRKMARASSFSDTVLVKFANEYPIKLIFKVLNKLQMSFILAPRIENK